MPLLVSLELIVLLEDSLWKGLEQITTVLGSEGNGQLSEEGHPVYNLTTFPFVQRISLCCAKLMVKVEYDKEIAINETMINGIMEARENSIAQ